MKSKHPIAFIPRGGERGCVCLVRGFRKKKSLRRQLLLSSFNQVCRSSAAGLAHHPHHSPINDNEGTVGELTLRSIRGNSNTRRRVCAHWCSVPSKWSGGGGEEGGGMRRECAAAALYTSHNGNTNNHTTNTHQRSVVSRCCSVYTQSTPTCCASVVPLLPFVPFPYRRGLAFHCSAPPPSAPPLQPALSCPRQLK